MSASANNQSLETLCNHILQVGLRSNWQPELADAVNLNTALFARLYIQRADRSAIEAAATELEASLSLCGTTHLETLATVTELIEELYDVVEAY
jgi:hypothetical protein